MAVSRLIGGNLREILRYVYMEAAIRCAAKPNCADFVCKLIHEDRFLQLESMPATNTIFSINLSVAFPDVLLVALFFL